MADYEAIIIGGGPAGLTAGLYLARAKIRSLLLEQDLIGGKIKNLEYIENYPGFAEGIPGPRLSNEMQAQSVKFGLRTEIGKVTNVESYSGTKCITCDDGRVFTTASIIIAGGSHPRKLGVPGEEKYRGKGVFNCAYCDGGQYEGKAVAVCGGGDSGITEALYMSKIASKVILLEALSTITATAILQDRASANPKIEILCSSKVVEIFGETEVTGLKYLDAASGAVRSLAVDGILIYVGLEPFTTYLPGVVPLDKAGQIIVNGRMETEDPGIFAAGDIRSESPGQVSTAVGDGATAAVSVMRYLHSSASD